MLLLFTLLTTLSFGGQPKADALGTSISEIAESYLQNRPRLTMEACNGLVQDILADAGIRMKGRVDSLWEQSRNRGWTHQRKVPRPGDLVFWHRTYDRNRNGRVDDRFTHIGVVIRVDQDHTIHMVHRSSKGIRPVRMNLHHPDTYRNGDTVYNDYLAANGYGKKDERLSGQLFAGFATLRSATELQTAPRPRPKSITATVKPKVAQLQASAPPPPSTTLIEDWNTVDARVRKRIVAGRGIHAGPLRDLTCKQLWATRNAIFARHGYAFQTTEAIGLFESLPWYERNAEVTKRTAAGYLTTLDYENLELVVRLEKRRCKR